MPLTKSEITTLKSIRKDAKALAKHAIRVADKAQTRLIREMKKS